VFLPAVSSGNRYVENKIRENPEQWKPVKSDFKYIHGQQSNYYNLNYKLDPKFYDIFAGLNAGEDRFQRVHLTGWWRLRRIPKTASKATWDPKKERWSGAEELRENDIGLTEQFWVPGTDDSQWPWHPVPWDWNKTLAPGAWRYNSGGGVGWYRRTFKLGAVPAGHRVILHFEYVGNGSTAWINGKKVGSYNVFEVHGGGQISRGVGPEQHEYDITTAAKPNAENQITVRVFQNGLHQYKAGSYSLSQAGGIMQPCWVDVRPPVYADAIHCTPRLKEGKLDLRCFFKSSLPKATKARLRVRVTPWQSYRYYPPVAGAAMTAAELGTKSVPSGDSDVRFSFKLEKPVKWDYEKPFLYHVRLYAELAGVLGKEVLVGQTRFGFRQFVTSGNQFLLNGKRCYMPGLQVNEPFRSDMFVAANIDDWCVGWYKMLRASNLIFMRWHSGQYPEPYYDVADEVGFLINPDRLKAHGNVADTPEFYASIRRYVDAIYNHPSVVIRSLGNEHLSNGVTREKMLKCSPPLSKLYDMFKELDPTRPVTPCSGSNGIHDLSKEERVRYWPKSDYHDLHDYTGGVYHHPIQNHKSIPENYNGAQAANPGTLKPYVNGECAFVPLMYEHARKPFEFLRKDLPDIDRKAYSDFINEFNIPPAGASSKHRQRWERRQGQYGWFLCVVGIGTFAEDIDTSLGYSYERILEPYRVWGMKQVNFQLHARDPFFSGKPEYTRGCVSRMGDVQRDVFRRKCRPILPVWLRPDRNCFAGRPLAMDLIAMNDSLHDRGKTVLSVAMKDGERICAELTIPIEKFTQKEHHTFSHSLPVPEGLKSGHYRIALTLKDAAGGGILSENSYRVHVLGDVPPAGDAQVRKILAYLGAENQGAALGKVLDRLGIAWKKTSDFSELKPDNLLIIGPDSLDKPALDRIDKIMAFTRAGGRLLVLCQNSYSTNPFVHGMLYRRITAPASTTDVVTMTHPIFRGFERKDFHLWNGQQYCADIALTPMTPAVLAATLKVRRRMSEVGMSVGEVSIGKGVYMFSQLKAMQNYDKDSVATRYINNLLRYSVGKEWTGSYAVDVTAVAEEKFKRPVASSCFFVDLRKHCNMGFVDEVANDHKGGGADQGPVGDLRVFPTGRHTFADVPFDIIDPTKNNGKSCIVLGSTRATGVNRKDWLPMRAEGIKIGKKLSHLYFLVSPTWTPYTRPGTKIATVKFHYEWGGAGTISKIDLDLVVGKNVTDWTVLSSQLPEAVIAFEKPHPLWDRNVGALLIPWKNPIPEEKIEAITIISTGEAVPIFLGITGATKVKDSGGVAVIPSGHWKFDEGKGFAVKDTLGNYTDAKLVRSVEWVPGRIGTAIRISGGRDRVDIPRPRVKAALGQQLSFTVSSWIKVDEKQIKGGTGIVSTWADNEDPYRGFALSFRGWGPWHLYFGLASAKVTRSDEEMNDGQWHHVAGVYDGPTRQATLYVDGVKQQRSGKCDYLPSPSPHLRLGTFSGTDWSRSLNGAIDELRIVGKALSAAEVAALSKAT